MSALSLTRLSKILSMKCPREPKKSIAKSASMTRKTASFKALPATMENSFKALLATLTSFQCQNATQRIRRVESDATVCSALGMHRNSFDATRATRFPARAPPSLPYLDS